MKQFRLKADITFPAADIEDALRVLKDGFVQEYREVSEDNDGPAPVWFRGELHIAPEEEAV